MIKKLNYHSIFKNSSEFHFANTVLDKSQSTYKHSHNFYEIFFLQEGKLIHSINKKKYKVKQKELCFIKPSDTHSFTNASNSTSCVMINIAFTKKFLENAIIFLCGQSFMESFYINSSPIPIDSILSELLIQQTNLLLLHESDYSFNQQSYIIKSLLINTLLQITSATQPRTDNIPIWLEKTCKLMHKKENYITGLKCFISMSGKSQEHLNRSMKKYMLTTPTVFINELRLREAAHLLRSSVTPVLDIIYESGFNNISHFNQEFKSRYGISPSLYRKSSIQIFNPE